MIISRTMASLMPSAIGQASAQRAKNAEGMEKIADTVNISPEARERLSSETAVGPSRISTSLRIEGTVHSFAEILKALDLPIFGKEFNEDQLNEIKLREQQEEARYQAGFEYAQAHPYYPAGQVVVGDKLVATVFEDGSYETRRQFSLSDNDASPESKLEALAKAFHGKVIHSDFQPVLTALPGRVAPEAALPPITARNQMEIYEQEIKPIVDKQIKEWEAQTGRKYPLSIVGGLARF